MSRYLQFRNYKTGEVTPRTNVTGYSWRGIELLMGPFDDIGEDWVIDVVTADDGEGLPDVVG